MSALLFLTACSTFTPQSNPTLAPPSHLRMRLVTEDVHIERVYYSASHTRDEWRQLWGVFNNMGWTDDVTLAVPPEARRIHLRGDPSGRVTFPIDADRSGTILCRVRFRSDWHECQDRTPPPRQTSAAEARAECRLHSDCSQGQWCNSGECTVECREDRDCDTASCEDGRCRTSSHQEEPHHE